MKDVDFGRTHDDYKAYRRGFPGEFFDRLVEDEVIKEGMTVLDLGTGTGTVARGFAKRDAVVIGLDKSELLLREAKALDAEDNVTVAHVVGKAEETSFGSESFDIVAAGQCWH